MKQPTNKLNAFAFRFSLCRAAVKSSFVNLDSRSNDEVKTVTKLVCEVSHSDMQSYGQTEYMLNQNRPPQRMQPATRKKPILTCPKENGIKTCCLRHLQLLNVSYHQLAFTQIWGPSYIILIYIYRVHIHMTTMLLIVNRLRSILEYDGSALWILC